MVGITIGLLTVAVAMSSMMVSRRVSGNVTDVSQLQQQASYAFRVIGQQVRQAGSMQLDLAANKGATEIITAEDVVAFTPNPEIYSAFSEILPNTPSISGKEGPASGEYKISLVYQNYKETVFPSGDNVSLFRDCLGAQPSSTLIQSQFVLDGDKAELKCAGSDDDPQSIIKNVGEFQVRYLIQPSAGLPSIQYVAVADVPDHPISGTKDWGSVYGVEICLVLYGGERIDMPNGSTYTGCDFDEDGNNVKVDMSSTGALPDARKNRLHMAFRSVYQLRSRSRIG